MAQKSIEGEKRVFMTGNEVVAWGALAAQADIMYGYPITPQNEIMHYWTRLAPQFNKRFLQTEDEISAGFATVGGVMAGKKAFTATAGPGNILMQESMSMAEMIRIPTVVVVQQRGGPSTATVIYSQQETILTCLGGNGEALRIVYSTATHQELFDYTIKAFNTAWGYRFPTFVLGDGYQAKMRESLIMYDPEVRNVNLIAPEPMVGKPGTPGVDREPAFWRNAFNTEEELYDIIKEQVAVFNSCAEQISEYQAEDVEGSDLIIVSHGVVSRAAKMAWQELREAGYKVGYFRPITLRPFPAKQMLEAASKTKALLITESAEGQLALLVRNAIYGATTPMESLFFPGVGVTPEEVVQKVKQLLG